VGPDLVSSVGGSNCAVEDTRRIQGCLEMGVDPLNAVRV